MLRFALIACLLLTGTASTQAAQIYLGFNGTDTSGNPGVGVSVGSGTFTFANNVTTIGLADLTSFNFSQQTAIPNQQASFTYSLSDLLTFSATVNTAGLLTSLSLTTRIAPAVPAISNLGPESFAVRSLAVNGASTYNSSGQELTRGTVVQTAGLPAPEPASLILMSVGVGMALVGTRYQRRRQIAA